MLEVFRSFRCSGGVPSWPRTPCPVCIVQLERQRDLNEKYQLIRQGDSSRDL